MTSKLVQKSLFENPLEDSRPPEIEVLFYDSQNPVQAQFFKETGLPCFFDKGHLINPEYLGWCERKLHGTIN